MSEETRLAAGTFNVQTVRLSMERRDGRYVTLETDGYLAGNSVHDTIRVSLELGGLDRSYADEISHGLLAGEYEVVIRKKVAE